MVKQGGGPVYFMGVLCCCRKWRSWVDNLTFL